MKQAPLLAAMLLFALGIFSAEASASWLWPHWPAFLFLFLLLLAWLKWPKISRILLLLLLVALGFLRMQFSLRGYHLYKESFYKIAPAGKTKAEAKGVVLEAREYPWGQVFTIALEEISIPLALPKRAKIEVSTSSQEKLQPGMLVRVQGTAVLPKRARNPYQRSQRRYLAQNSCYLSVRASSLQIRGKQFLLGSFLADKLAAPWQALPEAERGLLEAVVLGQRQALPEEVAEGFSALGLAHLLSVSGLHVGFVRLLCQSFAPPPVTIVLMLLYVLAAGFKPPAARALLMLSADLLAKSIGKKGQGLNFLGLAGLLLLLYNPLLLADAGFLLSFLATGSILVFNQLKPKGKLAKVLGLSVAAQLGTLPVQAHFFNQLVPLAPLSNLAFGGLLAVLVQGGLLSGLLSSLMKPLGVSLALGLYPIARLVNYLASFLGKLPFGVVAVRCLRWHEFVLYYAFLLASFAVWQKAKAWPDGLAGVRRQEKLQEGKRRILLLFLAAVLLWQLPQLGEVLHPRLTVHVFDVGQGDSILIRTPRGRFILVDGGPYLFEVDRLLVQFGVRKLALAVLTHQHQDHARGFWPAVEKRQPLLLWTDEDAPFGRRLRLDGVEVRLLGGGRGDDPNDRSLILLVRYRSYGFLLTGDAPAALVELALEGLELPKLVLKVPHHGGAGTVTRSLLAGRPFVAAAISCGEDNPYGHPSPETIRILGERQLPVDRTDRHGCLTYTVSGRGLKKSRFIWEKGLW